jgi:hypothetical protein
MNPFVVMLVVKIEKYLHNEKNVFRAVFDKILLNLITISIVIQGNNAKIPFLISMVR